MIDWKRLFMFIGITIVFLALGFFVDEDIFLVVIFWIITLLILWGYEVIERYNKRRKGVKNNE